MMTNNIKAGLLHGLAGVALVGIPVLLMGHVSWQDLTVGGILNIVYQWAIAYNRTA